MSQRDFVIQNGVLTKYQGPGGAVDVPAGVTTIGSSAFRDCTALTSVSLPGGLTEIGDWAFQDCTSLTSISLPDGLTAIGYSAFWGCTGLTGVSLPGGLTENRRLGLPGLYQPHRCFPPRQPDRDRLERV